MTIKSKLLSLFSNKFMILQFLFFIAGKICFLLVQLPKSQKQSSIILQLILASFFYTLSLSFKILQHKQKIVKSFLKIISNSFIIWIIGILVMMFTFVLQDKLQYGFLQKMLTMLVIWLQIICFILITHAKFITKKQFIFYQIVLSWNILALAQKSVWFIGYDEDQSQIKSILLLTLSTQIALTIILMQCIANSYKQNKKNRVIEMRQQNNGVERQLQISN